MNIKKFYLNFFKAWFVFIISVFLIYLNSSPELGLIERFFKWDSLWYLSICKEGYHTSVPIMSHNPDFNNLGFYPLYPILGRVLYLLSFKGLDPRIILLSLSWACSFLLFFMYFDWLSNLSWTFIKKTTVTTMLVLHPGFLSLFVAYSESLFILLGVLVFMLVRNRYKLIHEHTFLKNAALFFIGLVKPLGFVWPFLLGIGHKKPLVVFLSLFGGIAFWIYSYFIFGDPWLYHKSQILGWGYHWNFLSDSITLWPSFIANQWGWALPFDRGAILGVVIMLALRAQKRNFIFWSAGVYLVLFLAISLSHSFWALSRQLYPIWIALLLSDQGPTFWPNFIKQNGALRAAYGLSLGFVFCWGVVYFGEALIYWGSGLFLF